MGARTLMLKKLFQISAVSSSIAGRRTSASERSELTPMPALLMTASTRPNRATAAWTACRHAGSLARSATIA